MRYTSIDILRTIAISLMVLVHFVENLSGVVGLTPTGFAAPLFTFLSGVSYRLWLGAQEARGRKDSDVSKVTIRRGLFLFGTGFMFNILVWLPEDTFNWDILTFIGAALIFLNLVRKLPGPIPPLICTMVYLASPLLRAVSDYPAYWENGYFECDLTLPQVTLGFLVNGFFPFFPWIIFPVSGFAVASLMFPESRRPAAAVSRLMLVGLGMLGAATAAVLLQPYGSTLVQEIWLTGWTMFPASAEYVLGSLGIVISAFLIAHRFVDQQLGLGKESLIARVATTFSSHSFSIYLLHHVVHIWPLWIYGLSAGDDPTAYWMNAIPVTWALPLAIAFLVGSYFLFRWIDRNKFPSVESLMRWVCD